MKILIFLLLFCNTLWACEFGRAKMDTYGRPDSYDIAVGDDDGAYYFPVGSKGNTIWERIFFDKHGQIAISTGYTWCGNENPPPKGKEPYVLYKGHRWYPQYHGIIYVYKNGREVR